MDFETIKSRVIRDVDPKDSMLIANNYEQYFDVGESGIKAILSGLSDANKNTKNIRNILDYASGYGRVARWIKAAFPSSYITAVDADINCIRSLQQILSLNAVEIADLEMNSKIVGGPFDLIWMGSLITHFSELKTKHVLSYLYDNLSMDGLLIGTMHGPFVSERLRGRVKDYGLKETEIVRHLEELDASGYGFGPYHHNPEYGISSWTEEKGYSMFEDTGFIVISYKHVEWARHQDVFVLYKS